MVACSTYKYILRAYCEYKGMIHSSHLFRWRLAKNKDLFIEISLPLTLLFLAK